MSAPELGPWAPLALDEVVGLFTDAPFRWWISGGHALDLYVGRSWRTHEDIDVGILRADLAAVHDHLSALDVHVAAAGTLTPWHGEPLTAAVHQNNLWCRQDPAGPWMLDLVIGDGSDMHWTYRRDSTVRVPWDAAVLRTGDGTPYLAPELQLLYKSKGQRPKDDADAAEVIPHLDPPRRDWLADRLPTDHPWRALVAGTATPR